MNWKEWLSVPSNREAWNARRRERRSKKRKPSKYYKRELKKQNEKKRQQTLQLKAIEKENRRIFRMSLCKAVEKINAMRQSRMTRFKMQHLSYKQRVLLAIDYYYELVRQNTMKAA